MPYPTAKVLVLDIDGGIVESSFLAKASVNPVVSRILSLTPMLKKLALTLVETGETIWETKAIKPHEWVLDNLIEFAEAKEIGRHDVLICDYDPEFRFMAKTLGFRVYPDETIDIPVVYPTSIERRVALSF